MPDDLAQWLKHFTSLLHATVSLALSSIYDWETLQFCTVHMYRHISRMSLRPPEISLKPVDVSISYSMRTSCYHNWSLVNLPYNSLRVGNLEQYLLRSSNTILTHNKYMQIFKVLLFCTVTEDITATRFMFMCRHMMLHSSRHCSPPRVACEVCLY
jgi:hypothetical protein